MRTRSGLRLLVPRLSDARVPKAAPNRNATELARHVSTEENQSRENARAIAGSSNVWLCACALARGVHLSAARQQTQRHEHKLGSS
jgi:hypothetical protein